MSRRLLFLSGHLSGLLVGAALVWGYFSNASTTNSSVLTMPRNPVVEPVNYRRFPPAPNAAPLPEGWELRYFNRHPYYIIPVETDVRRTDV